MALSPFSSHERFKLTQLRVSDRLFELTFNAKASVVVSVETVWLLLAGLQIVQGKFEGVEQHVLQFKTLIEHITMR